MVKSHSSVSGSSSQQVDGGTAAISAGRGNTGKVDHATVARRLSDAMLRLHQAEGELMLALDLPGVAAPAYIEDIEVLRERITEINRELAVHYCTARDANERSLPRALAV